MGSFWIKRKAHIRKLKTGLVAYVRENWAFCCFKKNTAYRHPCPQCGKEITSIHMPNGGWVHNEAPNIKHACLHRGEDLSKKRDDATPDLFKDDTPNKK